MIENILTIVLAVIAGGLGAYITGQFNLKTTRIKSTETPYSVLCERVIELEKQVKELDQEIKSLNGENENLKQVVDRLKYEAELAKVEAERDRKYISEAAPWITRHESFARYKPPIPPEWYLRRYIEEKSD